MIGVGIFAGLIVLALLGDGLTRLLARARLLRGDPAATTAEGVGLRILFALAAVPWVGMLFDLLHIPFRGWTLFAISVIVWGGGLAIEGRLPFGTRVRGGLDSDPSPARSGSGAALLRSPAALVLSIAAGTIVAMSWIHTSLVPERNYDALVGYDLIGKVLAAEGRLRCSVFTRIPFNAQAIYPPFTSVNNGLWYVFHPSTPRFWVPLLAAGFLLVFAAWIRRRTGSVTAAALSAFVVFLPTAFLYQITVAQTDLPSMAFMALALLAAVDALQGRGRAAPVAVLLLIAGTARTENVMLAAGLTAVALLRRPRLWKSIWWTALPAGFFLFWNLLYVRVLFGYNPAAHFRNPGFDLGRAVEVFRRALTIPADSTAFGEFAWFVLLVIALWAYTRWRARKGGGGTGGGRTGRDLTGGDPKLDTTGADPKLDPTGAILLLSAAMFVFYMPYFYMWDPVLNPLWTMEHTYKRGFFRFIPGIVAAFAVCPPVMRLLRRCDGPAITGPNG